MRNTVDEIRRIVMRFILNDIINNYYNSKPKLNFKKNIFSILEGIGLLILLISLVMFFIFVLQNDPKNTFISLGVSLLGLLVTMIFSNLNDKAYINSDSAKADYNNSLLKLRNTLQNNYTIKIESREDIENLRILAEEFYNNKFVLNNKIQKFSDTVIKILLIPVLLASINYLLNNETLDANAKLIYLTTFSLLGFLVLMCAYYIFDIIKSFIEISNIKYKLLIDDLKIISHFYIKEVKETTQTKDRSKKKM